MRINTITIFSGKPHNVRGSEIVNPRQFPVDSVLYFTDPSMAATVVHSAILIEKCINRNGQLRVRFNFDDHILEMLGDQSRRGIRDTVQLPACTPGDLFFVGCSLTAGMGVGPGDRFSSLIAHQLGISCINHAVSGSSILYAHTVITHCITPGSKIVWGLTSPSRGILNTATNQFCTSDAEVIDPANHGCLRHVLDEGNPQLPSISNKVLEMYRQSTNILFVDFFGAYEHLGLPNYMVLDYSTTQVDFGNDGRRFGRLSIPGHPGVNSHKIFAELIYDKLTSTGLLSR